MQPADIIQNAIMVMVSKNSTPFFIIGLFFMGHSPVASKNKWWWFPGCLVYPVIPGFMVKGYEAAITAIIARPDEPGDYDRNSSL
jgi:Na+-transporting NADH:ubiquinone oxidoreductase subunit NqrB